MDQDSGMKGGQVTHDFLSLDLHMLFSLAGRKKGGKRQATASAYITFM